MSDILNIIKDLQQAKGSNAKKAILEANKNNVYLQRYLKLVYEPTVSYYMTAMPASSLKENKLTHDLTEEDQLQIIENTLNTLASRAVTGHAAKEFMSKLDISDDTRELLRLAILRDIKAGVAAATLVKTWPGLVTLVPYRRCVLPKDSNIKNWPWGQPGFYAYSQLKADGSYANANVTVNGAVFQTRNGTIYPSCSSFVLMSAFANALYAQYGKPIQIQGELLVYRDGKLLPRKEGNGILNSIIQTGEDPGPAYKVVFDAWDCIPLEEAVAKGKGSEPYDITFPRLAEKKAQVEASAGDTFQEAIRLIESKIVRTFEEAAVHFLEKVAQGFEGTIVKHKDAVWMDGDDKLQVKGKVEAAIDLRIIGFNAGDADGKHAATFGSLQVASECGQLETGLSGMTDELRKKIHENREFYMNKIVTVVFNDIMYSDNLEKEKHSVFLPRIVEIREDKTKADTFQQVVDQFEAAKKGITL